MKHDMQAWLAGLFGPGPKKPLPILSFPGAQLLGVCVRSLVTSAQLQADCMLAVAKRTPAAAAVSPMDLSVEVECFGAPVRFADDEVPTIPEAIVQDEEDARRVLQECSGFDNFLLSSGCDIPPQASWDNIDAFFHASQAFYLSK